MKIAVFILVTGISLGSFAQTAPDIIPIDCHGNARNLHANLDAGKIIVVGWTMPCSACVPPLLEAHDAVLSFELSNPGVVEFWVNDDIGDSDCNMITGWSEFYGISDAIYFSSTILTMDDFGVAGMPKVVVMGCGNHTVYYNVNDTPTGIGVTAAINQALSDIAGDCLLNLSDESEISNNELLPYPIPADGICSFMIEPGSEVETIEVVSMNGKRVFMYEWSSKDNVISFDVSGFENGMYFLSIGANDALPKRAKIEIRH